MARGKGGFYAVRNGREQGVYNNWEDCKKQVSGYGGASYKRFDKYEDALAFSDSRAPSTNSSHPKEQHYSRSDRGTYTPSNPASRSSSYTSRRYSGYSPYPKNLNDAKKYYSVKSSNSEIPSRIFENWKECERYVKGRKGLSFKKFEDKSSAVQFMNGTADDQIDFKHAGFSKDQFTAKFKLPASSKKYTDKSRVYCDGSALANGTNSSVAGYGVYFADEPGNDISEPLRSGAQTNNRAEIQAVSSALDKIWHNLTEYENKKCYEIKTDSEYVSKLLNDRYFAYSNDELARLPNSDLIIPMLEKFTRVKQFYNVNQEAFGNDGRFAITWVKGHAGEPGNEKADELARRGAQRN